MTASAKPSWSSLLSTTLEQSLRYLNDLEERPVGASKNAAALRRALQRPLPEAGTEAQQIIEELARDVEGGLHAMSGGRFFGWVNGGTLPAALAADWLTSAWDQNAGMYSVGPAASMAEEVAGEWLKQMLRLPTTASFALVTGSQMAHVTCLAAARHALLARRGWDVEERGLNGSPPLRLLCSAARHGSIMRAVKLLGLGSGNIESLPTDQSGRVQPEALRQALQADPDEPAIICLQAGDINTGAFDRFAELIPIARGYRTWVHIDGAIGLWVAASDKLAHLVRGAEGADSWTTDGHKWLNTPYDCGYAFVADAASHRAAFTLQAAYLSPSTEARDAIDWNPEWSRRARGFATYAAIRQLGRQGVAEMVERGSACAHELISGMGRLPGVEVLALPIINQGMVRFLSSRPQATELDHDQRTNAVIAAIAADGGAFFTGTTWQGKRAMRVSVSGWNTTLQDVERSLETVQRTLAGLASV